MSARRSSPGSAISSLPVGDTTTCVGQLLMPSAYHSVMSASFTTGCSTSYLHRGWRLNMHGNSIYMHAHLRGRWKPRGDVGGPREASRVAGGRAPHRSTAFRMASESFSWSNFAL